MLVVCIHFLHFHVNRFKKMTAKVQIHSRIFITIKKNTITLSLDRTFLLTTPFNPLISYRKLFISTNIDFYRSNKFSTINRFFFFFCCGFVVRLSHFAHTSLLQKVFYTVLENHNGNALFHTNTYLVEQNDFIRLNSNNMHVVV